MSCKDERANELSKWTEEELLMVLLWDLQLQAEVVKRNGLTDTILLGAASHASIECSGVH